MDDETSGRRGFSRRAVLGAGVAAFFAALAPEVLVVARARAATDPRSPLVDRLCDLVIPPTDTPGAAEAGAGAFVLLALDHGIGGLEAKALTQVQSALDAAAAGAFLRAAPARQEALLTELDRKAFAGEPAAGSAELAWRALKPAIVAGYYTSEIGGSKELVFEPVPDSVRTNFKLTPDYRARSNEGFGGIL
jgi:hypothetical protein